MGGLEGEIDPATGIGHQPTCRALAQAHLLGGLSLDVTWFLLVL